MGLLDELKNAPPNSLGGTDKSFIDADTLIDKQGEKYRIQGVDAAEVEKVIDGKYKPGTAGGAATTGIIRNLATEQGYTNITPLLDENGEPQRDPFGRIITDLTNESGESFKSALLEAGAFDVNKYTTDQDIAATGVAEAKRNKAILEGTYQPDEFEIAARKIKEAEYEEGAKRQGFRQTLLNEAELAQAKQAGQGRFYADNVQIRRSDRTLSNDALNPFSDSWEQGWTGFKESAYGALSLLGDVSGNEWLENVGEDGVARYQADQLDYANKILNYTEVEGFGDAIEYLGNNLAMSIPYMAATSGAAVAGSLAAPIVGGVAATTFAIGAPAAVYAGQTWNEQEGVNKNASIAIASGVAQATLDRLGLDAIFKKGVAPKKLLDKAKEALVARGLSPAQASQQIAAASKKEIAGFVGDAAQVAKSQLAAKELFKQVGGRALLGAGGEAVTEAAQESIGYYASHTQEGFDFNELNNRIVSAAIAGGSLGGAFSVPGSVSDALAWTDVAGRLGLADPTNESQSAVYAAEEKAEKGYVPSIQENLANTRAALAGGVSATMNERAEQFKADRGRKSSLDRIAELPGQVGALWKGTTRNIFTPELQAQSRTARMMADMFGGNLQRIYSGANFENEKHHRVAKYKNMVDAPDAIFKEFAGNKLVNATRKGEIGNQLYSTLNSAVTKDGKFDPALVPDGPNKNTIVRLGQQLNALSDQMYKDQKKHNPELGYIDNYLFKAKTFNKTSVAKNRSAFESALVKKYKLDRNTARDLTDNILDNDNVGNIDEAFSVTEGGIIPGSHRKRSLALSEQAEFQQFMEQDLFANVSNAVKSAARYTSHRDFIGKDGEVISKLLDNMQAEGVDAGTVNKVANQMKNYLDAESGNYKRPTTQTGKKAQAMQKNFMMVTTLAGLPLATISSFVEYALVHRGLTKDQIFGKKGSLATSGREFASTMWDAAGAVADLPAWAADKQTNLEGRSTAGRQKLKDLGYYDWDVGAATTTGVSEVNQRQKEFYEGFFKYTGLQGWTNYTRASRAAISGDYMMDKVQKISDQRTADSPRTKEIQEAEEALRNLGIDVDQFVKVTDKQAVGVALTPEEEAFMESTVREASFNFVNDAVALPQAANRPLIYQDPRFALFTQFQGFIATFTANHIPKLWGEYVKRGTPAMKYSAFATMTTMIMLGFASQHLKDLIKHFGEDDEEGIGANPYLDAPEYIQRGVRASGLLGSGERVLDLFFPIYEQSSKNPGDWAFKQATGESPALGTALRAGKGIGKFAEGDVEGGIYNTLKAAPYFGPFTSGNKWIASILTPEEWKYKGDR